MRVKKSLKNIKYNFIFLIINLIATFILRAILINSLNANIVGFNSLIINLMGFLNIAELGVAAAITYSLYEPIKDENYEKINEIMILFRYYYNNIAKVVFIIGVIVGLFLKFFIKGQIPMMEAYFYYVLFLINTVSMYFFMYKQTLIIANQKEYIVVGITNGLRLVKVIVQGSILILTRSYLYYIVLEIIFNLGTLIIISNKANKLFNQVNFKSSKSIIVIKEENKILLKNIKDIFVHKISEFLVFKTDGILISLFLTLKETAIYANYMLIISGVLSIFNGVMVSFTASIGNLIAEGNHKKNYEVFKKLYLLDNFIAIIATFCLYKLMNGLTTVWIGKEYLFGMSTVLVLVINVYIQIARGSLERFKTGYGIFWDKWAPAVEGTMNLIVSLFLIKKIGVLGLVIGTLISNIVVILLWKPYVVYKYGFKINPLKHVILFLNVCITAITSFIISDAVNDIVIGKLELIGGTFLSFVVMSIITFSIIGIVTFGLFLLKKDFRLMINSVGSTIFKRNVKGESQISINGIEQ